MSDVARKAKYPKQKSVEDNQLKYGKLANCIQILLHSKFEFSVNPPRLSTKYRMAYFPRSDFNDDYDRQKEAAAAFEVQAMKDWQAISEEWEKRRGELPEGRLFDSTIYNTCCLEIFNSMMLVPQAGFDKIIQSAHTRSTRSSKGKTTKTEHGVSSERLNSLQKALGLKTHGEVVERAIRDLEVKLIKEEAAKAYALEHEANH